MHIQNLNRLLIFVYLINKTRLINYSYRTHSALSKNGHISSNFMIYFCALLAWSTRSLKNELNNFKSFVNINNSLEKLVWEIAKFSLRKFLWEINENFNRECSFFSMRFLEREFSWEYLLRILPGNVYNTPCTLCLYTFWIENAGSPDIVYGNTV